MRPVWAILAVFLLALPVRAQELHDALDAAYGRWLTEQGTTGMFASGQRAADGRWDSVRQPDAAALGALASTSKALTAVCVLSLVQEGRVLWSDRLPDILGDASDSARPLPDASLAQLLTHTSGLSPDSTQMTMPSWLDKTPAAGAHYSRAVLDTLSARTQQGPAGAYVYNNENYALLALVIEAVTGQPFFQHCAGALDLPDGVAPDPRTGGMLPWGGLAADPLAYLTFLHTHFGPDGSVGRDPFSLPHVEIGDGVHYGLGMLFRRSGDGVNFWHFGTLCFPGRFNTGSFAVLWEGRVSALAIWDACVDGAAMAQLDGALSAAAFGRAP